MSQLKVNSIVDASGGSNAQLYGVASPPNSMGFRNRLINPGMVIDQRNVGASFSPTTTSGYTLDRWVVRLTQNSKLTVQQNAGSVTPPAGFANYLGVTSSSAYSVLSTDVFTLAQAIEGFNTADLGFGTANAASVTLSFWVRSSLTGSFGGALINSASNRSYPFSYTISAANTWEQKTVTIAGDTSGTWLTNSSTGIEVRFGLGSGSNYTGTANVWGTANAAQPPSTVSVVGTNGATFYITGVQLEAGTVASAFERRDYGRELIMCQRYFNKFGAQLAYVSGGMMSANDVRGWITFPVEMRATPSGITTTITGYGGGATQVRFFANGGFVSNSSFTFGVDFASPKSISFALGNMSGTSGAAGSWDFGSSAFILVPAEL